MRSSALARNLAIGIAAALILAGCMSEKVSFRKHPNLAQAQQLIQDAMDKLSAAQGANEFDMGGHAAKARALLGQAYDQIKLAALAANAR